MEHKGIKASELIKELEKYIDQFGDLYVGKDKNGDVWPILFINHHPNTDYIELI